MKKKDLLILIVGSLCIGCLCFYMYEPFIHFMTDFKKLRQTLQSYGVIGELILVLIMALQVVFAFLPGEIVEIAAGYLYGSIGGMIICLLGSAIGSTIIFKFVQKYGIKFIRRLINIEKLNSLDFFYNREKRNILCFILFFIPGTPKDILTYFIPLTDMNFSTFLLITTIARIPSIITSTVGGNAIGVENYMFSIIVFVVTGIISCFGIFIYKKISERKVIPSNL